MKYKIIIFFVLFLLFMMIIILTSCPSAQNKNESYRNDTVALTKSWERAISNQQIPDGLTSLRAADCGKCHQTIYNEWKLSTHAVAFEDTQFQMEMKKDGVYACLNCHTPLQNQQENIVTGLINGDYRHPVQVKNPLFDSVLKQESITCGSCHIREGKIIGPIGSTNAPHRTIRDTVFLSERLCIGCHNVVDEFNPTLVCTFETGDEWKKNWASKSGKTCITCHMPEMKREIAVGTGIRISHLHFFPGSGIPKFKGAGVKGFNGLIVKEDTLKHIYKKGEIIRYTLHLKNENAGHNVPTGDPERYFLITFTLTDKNDSVLKDEKFRVGEQWQWYPVAKKLSDNNIQPLEERAYTFDYKHFQKGKISLTVKVTKHRMSEENAKTDNLNDYPLSITVFEKLYMIEVN